MALTIEEKRERRRVYMRRYRKGKSRSEEGKRYWQANKQRIMAQRKAKPRTDDVRAYHRVYAKRYRQRNPEKVAAIQRRHNAKNPGRMQRNKRRRQEAIAGRPRPTTCEICAQPGLIRFDHCHQTGVFRGWICNSCNVVLGYVRDDPDHLRKLIVYLEATKRA